ASQTVAHGPVVGLVEQFEIARQLVGLGVLALAAQFFEAQQERVLFAQAADDALRLPGDGLDGLLVHGVYLVSFRRQKSPRLLWDEAWTRGTTHISRNA